MSLPSLSTYTINLLMISLCSSDIHVLKYIEFPLLYILATCSHNYLNIHEHILCKSVYFPVSLILAC